MNTKQKNENIFTYIEMWLLNKNPIQLFIHEDAHQ